MTTAKVVEKVGVQTIRLPKGFRLRGDEVEVIRRGDDIILREKRTNLAELFEILTSLSDDFMEEGRQQPPVQPDGASHAHCP